VRLTVLRAMTLLLMIATVVVIWMGGMRLAVPCFLSFVMGLIMAKRGPRSAIQLSTRDLAILREIDDHVDAGAYGLRIAEKVGRPWWKSIYIDLHDLEDQGFVDSELAPDQDSGSFPRRVYRLSARGRVLVEIMGDR